MREKELAEKISSGNFIYFIFENSISEIVKQWKSKARINATLSRLLLENRS